LIEVARIYSQEFERIQHRLVELFTIIATQSWDAEHCARFQALFSEEMERFAHDVRVISDYTQQRNMQRRVLDRIEQIGAHHVQLDAEAPPAAVS
jgi:hypothetical protein